MVCDVPYCVSGVPYFSALTKCGFEEELGGGIVDCIQTINMSGINELLVSQGRGSAMSNHHPDRLHELETLLEFPPQVISETELENRFQDLCRVLQRACDNFRCREDQENEDQENPLRKLLIQLQKAKARFHARVTAAEGKDTTRLGGRRFKTGSSSNKKDVNPFQELRDAFCMARKHFIPLIDQYISDNTSIGPIGGAEKLGACHYCHETRRAFASDVTSRHQAVNNSSGIRSTSPMEEDYNPKPPSSNACRDTDITSSYETRSVEMGGAHSADFSSVLNEDPADHISTYRPPSACHDESKKDDISMRLIRKEMPCRASNVTEINSNPTNASRLGALITKELQRRCDQVTQHETEDFDHETYRSKPSTIANPTVEGPTVADTDLTPKPSLMGCAPNFFAKLRFDLHGSRDPTSPLEGDTLDEISSTDRATKR